MMARYWMTGFVVLSLFSLGHTLATEQCDKKYQAFKGHTACLSKSPKAKSVEMTDSLKAKIVLRHNEIRAAESASDMMKLTWDDELEMLARKWADACDVRGGLRHDSLKFIPGGMDVGQNMASGMLDFDIAINMWWFERAFYIYGVNYTEQIDNMQWGFAVGHYTQMVWAATNKIGCAATDCGGGYFGKVIVCNYGPAGNKIEFSKPFELGQKCGQCKNCTQGGLCDCGDLQCNGGSVDPSTCTCDCRVDGRVQSFMPEPYCELRCANTKDIWYCGKGGYSDCTQASIVRKCPHMCGVCPSQ